MKKITKSLMTLALLGMGVTSVSADDWTELPVQGWVHEWQTMEAQTDAEKLPDNDGVYTVFCRSSEQGEEAGNLILADGKIAAWDSQFFITLGAENELHGDDVIRVSFSYKADNAATVGTQSHSAPGSYIDFHCFGDIAFTTAWQDFSGEFTVGDGSSPVNGTYTFAFNLSDGNENQFYFKNIKVEKKVITVDPYADWVSIVDTPVKKEYPGNPEPAVADNGGVYEVVCPAKVSETWDSQFWLTMNQTLDAGKKFRVTFEYKASVATSVDTQCHAAPGSYIHYAAIGNVNFKEEWETFKQTVTVPNECAGKDFKTIALNLAQNSSEEVTFYFRNIDIKVAPEDVSKDEEPDWVDLVANGDMEGDDAGCFIFKEPLFGGPFVAEIEDGIGNNASRGVKLTSADREDTGEVDDSGNIIWTGADWDCQFWIRLTKQLPSGTKFKLTFDYMADKDAHFSTQAHGAPGAYIAHGTFSDGTFAAGQWQPFEYTGAYSDGQGRDMYCIAFNLSENHEATTFYFDNIHLYVDANKVDIDALPDAPEANPIPENATVEISPYGYATFTAPCGVEFEGLEAYTLEYAGGSTASLNQIFEAPANATVLLYSETPGTYNLPIERNPSALPYPNQLKGSDGNVAAKEENSNIYVLANGEAGVGFYLLKGEKPLDYGKGYLEIDEEVEFAREFIALFNNSTGINEAVKNVTTKAATVYNLQGQRVVKAQKGLYIQNGKKLLK